MTRVDDQFKKFNKIRRVYKFAVDKPTRTMLQSKLVELQVYADLELGLNKNLTEDEKLMLQSMGRINIGRPNDKESYT